ncbi:MAG: hypothetical protein FJ096_14375 [Deltaproteobacteria bacterium]|nr:hypothetical protein [Deltaproteobacteria bacterium]
MTLVKPRQAARVNRGGSWNNDDASNVRSANHNRNDPTNQNDNLGFRCARLASSARVGVTALAPAPRQAAAGENPLEEGGGSGGSAPDLTPVNAVLTIVPRDIWARPLLGGELAIAIDGKPFVPAASAASVEVPLRKAATVTVSLAAKDHKPIALELAFDGSRSLGGLTLASAPPTESAAALAHRPGKELAHHELHLGLAHDWFSSQARPPRRGNAVELYTSGEAAWKAVRADVELAKQSVLVSTRWWQSDFELTRTNAPLSPDQRWSNTALGILEKSPAYKRVLVGQFLGQDGKLSSVTWDAQLKARGPALGDGFEVMGQANPASGTFWFEPTPVDFEARVRGVTPVSSDTAFDALPPIASVVPAREVDLTQWPIELDVSHGSYHQKFAVVDDRVAFVGGMNVKEVDWDTDEHRVFDRRRMRFDATEAERIDVANRLALPDNDPRKDYMLRIEGPAAADVADVFQRRWQHQLDAGVEYAGTSTPFEVKPDPSELPDGVEVQITTTLPQPFWEHGIAETWFKAVARAEKFIFIEDQYFRAPMLNELIAKRMQERPELLLVVVTQPVSGWFDPGCAWTHQSHALFASKFPARYLSLQLRSLDVTVDESPLVWDETDAHFVDMGLHSKMLIVDDRFMSIGSANKNNRGMVYEAEMNAVVIEPSWVREQRRRLLGLVLPPNTVVADDPKAWFAELASAALFNDAAYDAWKSEDWDLDLDGAPISPSLLPRGFLYSLSFGTLADCLFESVGPDQTSAPRADLRQPGRPRR